MQAVMYLRKSRADDAGEDPAVTLRRHEATLRELGQREGVTLCGIYREVASGDRLSGRQEMQRLLADCESGRFEAVLCMDIDRLGRGSMAEQGYILDTFKRYRIRLITPRKTFDLTDEMDETYSEFESFIARQELKAIKRRLQRGVRRSVAEGAFVSAPPFGYQRTVIEGHPTLLPQPEEAEAVAAIFRMYTVDGLGGEQIAHRLNTAGYLPRRAAHFTRSGVLAILRNPVYAGRVVRQSSRPDMPAMNVPGLHPPLISPATFAQAQALRQRRSHPPAAPHRLQNPLAGLVQCGYCGARLQRLPPSATRRQETLACPHPGCNRSVKLSLVEEAVLSVLMPRLPDVCPACSQTLSVSDTAPMRRQQIKMQADRLYTLLEQGVYSPEEFMRRRQQLNREADALPSPASSAQAQDFPTAQAFAAADPASRNQLYKLFFSRIVYTKTPESLPAQFTLDLYWRPPD